MYRQRRFGVRTTFEFDDERFTYGIGDVSSTHNVVVHYGALDFSGRGEFEFSNNQFFMRWTPLLLPLAFVGLFCFQIPAANRFLGTILIVLLVFVVAFAFAISAELARVSFTEIPTFAHDANGVRSFVRIVRDRQHDTILEELENHWRQHMRKLHAHLDLAADREKEEARLAALLQYGIISEEEHRNMIETLHTAVTAELHATSQTTH